LSASYHRHRKAKKEFIHQRPVVRSRVVYHRKVDIQEPDLYQQSDNVRMMKYGDTQKVTNQFGVRMDDLRDALARERLLPESPFDIIQHLSVRRVVLVQHIPELEVCRAEAITEMLRKDPPAVYE
jgi:hypothetical protein